MAEHIARRLHSPDPKRMLALDGGGVRGAITLGFLAEIERLLAARFADSHYDGDASRFRLAHYYDMIGGTSVGSMLAVQLAWGLRVSDVERNFRSSAPKIFKRSRLGRFGSQIFGEWSDWLQQARSNVFDARTVRGATWGVVGNEPLGSDKLQTGLTIIAKRVDTGSVWALNNNPGGRYYAANKDYPLPDLVRASTAAPTYFAPKSIGIFSADVATVDGLFVDGGVSPHNNPSLKMFMMAGTRGHNFGGASRDAQDYPVSWQLGADRLLLTSIGTGCFAHKVTKIENGLDAVDALMGVTADAQELVLTVLQWMSKPQRPWHIDRMYGDLSGDHIGSAFGASDGLLTFERYDAPLEGEWLARELGLELPKVRIDALRNFINILALRELFEIGAEAARRQVSPDDFPSAFDETLWIDGQPVKASVPSMPPVPNAPKQEEAVFA